MAALYAFIWGFGLGVVGTAWFYTSIRSKPINVTTSITVTPEVIAGYLSANRLIVVPAGVDWKPKEKGKT